MKLPMDTWRFSCIWNVCLSLSSCSAVSSSCRSTVWQDYILPDSSVHGILQARILECVVIHLSRDRTQSPTLQADSLLAIFHYSFLYRVPPKQIKDIIYFFQMKRMSFAVLISLFFLFFPHLFYFFPQPFLSFFLFLFFLL